ncbi:MAG: 50S ribosomal protein L25 [Firmicutes bacterium]|nr:50S ribosomal protein L25 [Bacillota bacterium]
MRQVIIRGELRQQTGKGAARRMRASRRVPAVVYGKGEETTIISLDEREFGKAMQAGLGGGTLIRLVLSKDADEKGPDEIEKTAILKEVQSDVVRGNVIHVDFQAISMDEAITTKVPVVLVGEESRPNDGGIMQHMIWELEVHALPMDIPERVEVDVSKLEIGDSIKVGDLDLPEDVQANTGEDEVIILVAAPDIVVEEEEEAEEEDEELTAEGATEDHVATGGHETE